MTLSSQQTAAFRKLVWRHYRCAGRDFPWRHRPTPYRVLVSEMMLQQTQTERVAGYYKNFLKRFPSVAALAQADLRSVLSAWQGLGYNRRAKYLQQIAQCVWSEHRGKFPADYDYLTALPGIGQSTAGALLAFAFNRRAVFIETNIRTVFLHHFFNGRQRTGEKAVLAAIAASLPRRNYREWYWALMDYGNFLKRSMPRPKKKGPAARTKHASEVFADSNRYVRGQVIKQLLTHGSCSLTDLVTITGLPKKRLQVALTGLVAEDLIRRHRQSYSIT